jgi:cyclophilin family peptidyl-prolyl cis-trans isomerase
MAAHRIVAFLLVGCFWAVGARAQSLLPAVSRTLPIQAVTPGVIPRTVDLRDHLTMSGVTGQLVRFDTVLGRVNVELLSADAPQSVTNFLSYVSGNSYSSTIIHRSLPLNGAGNRIVQGGGYVSSGTSITRRSPIPLEYRRANTRGTLAMARTSEPNTATSEWFFNVDDNTSTLGQSNGGGYAVFGRVIGSGMTVIDAIAALPNFNAGGAFTNIPLRDMQPGQTQIQNQNLVLVNSISTVNLQPTLTATGVMSYSVTSSDPGVVSAVIRNNYVLSLTAPGGSGRATINVRASDTDGNSVDSSFIATVGEAAVFTTQPVSQVAAAGAAVTLTAAATNATSYQWVYNGETLEGATGPTWAISNLQPSNAGIYYVIATNASGDTVSSPAMVGLTTTAKVLGSAAEVGTDIQHPNGNRYDQVLLQGPAASVTADPGQVTRISFLSVTDDIMQVEFAGSGTLTVGLSPASGPAAPVKYNQPGVAYMKGVPSIVIAGAREDTNVSIFTVGRINAVNQALFRDDVTYTGIGDTAVLGILSENGKFGGVRTSNNLYLSLRGPVGLFAPGVEFTGPVFLLDVVASDFGVPMIITGSVSDLRLTGGSLFQQNGQPVRVEGFTRLTLAAGTTSHGTTLSARSAINARLVREGVDVTDQVTVGN